MRDPTSLEPKNGDFVAYVEALQADQAALLKAANSGRMSLSDMEEVLEESEEPRASATAALLESLRKRARDAMMSLPTGHSSGSNDSTGSDSSDGAVLMSPIGRKRTGRRKDARSATPFGRLVGYGVAALGFALLLIFMNLPDSEPAVPFAVMMIFAGLYLAGGDAKKK